MRDLETGTFITRDPLGFVNGPNLYTYVAQNPWTKFDPEGLQAAPNDNRQENPPPQNPPPAAVPDQRQAPEGTQREQQRQQMAQNIVNSEARRDREGRLRSYNLPANDGGGDYEVAGINSHYHPEMARQLRDMINRGQHAEAEVMARDYIARYTDRSAARVNNPAVEMYVRDTAFNRGSGGADQILREAAGLPARGPMNEQALAAIRQAEQNPEQFLRNLRTARENYENRVAPGRENLRPGLENRWDGALNQARQFLPAQQPAQVNPQPAAQNQAPRP